MMVKVPAGIISLFIRDSSTFVVSDFYEEASHQIAYISGKPGSTASGRVTMSCLKHLTCQVSELD
jgi:hypothetical protein